MLWHSVTQDELNNQIDKMIAGPQPLTVRLYSLGKSTPLIVWLNTAIWVWMAVAWGENWRQVVLCLLPASFYLWIWWPIIKKESLQQRRL